MSKAWRVQAREDSVAILGANGDEMFVSVKEYASAASARRAARNAVEAFSGGVVFEYENADGEMVTEEAAVSDEPSQPAGPAPSQQLTASDLISVPEPGVSAHAHSPYAQ